VKKKQEKKLKKTGKETENVRKREKPKKRTN